MANAPTADSPGATPTATGVSASEVSSSTVDAVGEPTVLERLRTRERRFVAMAGLYVFSIVLLFSSAGRFWWTARVALPLTSTGSVLRSATTGLSPSWLVHHGLMGQFVGIPTPIAYALLACGLGIVSVMLRSGTIGVPAIVCEVFAWHAMSAITANLTVSGTSIRLASGASLFTGALVVTTILLVLTSAQIAWINHRIHAVEREEAHKAGRPIQPSLLDMVHSFQLMHLARFSRGTDIAEREAQIARHDVPPQ